MGTSTLSGTKNGAMVDFVSCFPETISKSGTKDTCKTGFVGNGMCDTESHIYLDMHNILNKYKEKRYVIPTEMELLATLVHCMNINKIRLIIQ